MILHSNNSISVYPFIPTCSMELRPGLPLSPDAIRTVLLYPECGDVDYAQIIRIGMSDYQTKTAEIEIGGPRGELLCTVVFLLEGSDPLTGTAYRNGSVCGSMLVSTEILPILNAEYVPRLGSLVFAPSVFRPRALTSAVGSLRNSDNESIQSVTFPELDEQGIVKITPIAGGNSYTITLGNSEADSESVTKLSFQVSYSSRNTNDTTDTVTDTDTATDTDIVKFDSTKDGDHLRVITTKGSPIRVYPSGGEIHIGVGCEI